MLTALVLFIRPKNRWTQLPIGYNKPDKIPYFFENEKGSLAYRDIFLQRCQRRVKKHWDVAEGTGI